MTDQETASGGKKALSVSELEAENQDEIDQVLGEMAELSKEMGISAEELSKMVAATKEVPASAAPKEAAPDVDKPAEEMAQVTTENLEKKAQEAAPKVEAPKPAPTPPKAAAAPAPAPQAAKPAAPAAAPQPKPKKADPPPPAPAPPPPSQPVQAAAPPTTKAAPIVVVPDVVPPENPPQIPVEIVAEMEQFDVEPEIEALIEAKEFSDPGDEAGMVVAAAPNQELEKVIQESEAKVAEEAASAAPDSNRDPDPLSALPVLEEVPELIPEQSSEQVAASPEETEAPAALLTDSEALAAREENQTAPPNSKEDSKEDPDAAPIEDGNETLPAEESGPVSIIEEAPEASDGLPEGSDSLDPDAEMMKEFGPPEGSVSGAGDAGMEGTLANLKAEDSGSGESLFDQLEPEAKPPKTAQAPQAKAAAPKPQVRGPKSKAVQKPALSVVENESDAMEDDYEIVDSPALEEGTASGSIAMTVEGNLRVQLNHKGGGQAVSVHFSERFIRIQIANGPGGVMELNVPILKRKKASQAA